MAPGTELPHYPILEAAIETIADWVNRYRRRTGAARELAECDPAEVRRIASELGVTEKELQDLAEARPGSADLLERMLPALGIDPRSLAHTDPSTLRDLQRLCVTCKNQRQCRKALDPDGKRRPWYVSAGLRPNDRSVPAGDVVQRIGPAEVRQRFRVDRKQAHRAPGSVRELAIA